MSIGSPFNFPAALNADPVNVSLDRSQFIDFIKWEVVFNVRDGGGIYAEDVTLEITQE